MFDVDTNEDIDQVAIRNNYVSITPIHFDLTDYDTFKKMKNWHVESLMNEKEI